MKRKPLRKMRDLIEMHKRAEIDAVTLESLIKGRKELYAKAKVQVDKWYMRIF